MQYLSQIRFVSLDRRHLQLGELMAWGFESTVPYMPQLPPVDVRDHACVDEPWGDGSVAGGMSAVDDGAGATWFVTRIPGLGDGAVAASSDWVALRHSAFDSPRVYLSSECGKPYEYAQHRLLGGSIRFTLDVSSIGCNCIGAFYLSSMPAVDAKGARAAGTDSYCDAPGYNGFPCPEMDLVEANRFTLATTLHGCVPHEGAPDRWRRHADETYPNGAYWGACDDWGCAASTNALPTGSYGPGVGNTINTNAPFRVEVSFPVDHITGQLAGVRTTLSQGDREVAMDVQCDAAQLALMTRPLFQGMVAVGSHWGGDASWVSWLDAPYPCPEDEACLLSDEGSFFTVSSVTATPGQLAGASSMPLAPASFNPPVLRLGVVLSTGLDGAGCVDDLAGAGGRCSSGGASVDPWVSVRIDEGVAVGEVGAAVFDTRISLKRTAW
mmetsp:Transcript_26981/g.72412  ORF Transcript_26981/g.72412 Transcript_26981/m.72412 type:complete len:439 (+) Transcript_26981:456-1772(+)